MLGVLYLDSNNENFNLKIGAKIQFMEATPNKKFIQGDRKFK